MRWLNKEFKDYVNRKGLQVLRDDYRFIEKCIRNMPQNEQRLVMRRYCSIWNRVMAETQKVVLKQNYGRFKANCYLREYAERIK